MDQTKFPINWDGTGDKIQFNKLNLVFFQDFWIFEKRFSLKRFIYQLINVLSR